MRLFIFIIIYSWSHFLFAQENDIEETHNLNTKNWIIQGGIHFSSIKPIQQLKNKMNAGYGLGLNALLGNEKIPIYGGIGLDFLFHDNQTLDLILQNDGIDDYYILGTSNYSILGNLLLRFEPQINFPVIPFIDGILGFSRFATWTNLKLDEDYYDEDEDTSFDQHSDNYREIGDGTHSYGIALGLKIRFSKYERNAPNLGLIIRVAYRKGGAAKFLSKTEGDHSNIIHTIEAFEEHQSFINMLVFQVGINFSN